MRFKYHKKIVDMLYNEWDLGKIKTGARGKTCAWIYWFEVLAEAEEVIYESASNNIIGVCAYSKWDSRKHWLRKNYYALVKKLITHSFLIKNKKEMQKYDEDYDFLPEELESNYDGELSIIIVDKKYRGKGIGKKLFARMIQLAKRDKMNKMVILTDETSNYSFYERKGLKKIYEKRVDNGEPDENGHIGTEMGYAYELDLMKEGE